MDSFFFFKLKTELLCDLENPPLVALGTKQLKEWSQTDNLTHATINIIHYR